VSFVSLSYTFPTVERATPCHSIVIPAQFLTWEFLLEFDAVPNNKLKDVNSLFSLQPNNLNRVRNSNAFI